MKKINAALLGCLLCGLGNAAPNAVAGTGLDRCVNLTEPQNYTIPAAAAALGEPIVFVTQQPLASDFEVATSSFGNHIANPDNAGRGGDLWLMYPPGCDASIPAGCLRNLTREQGLGLAAEQQFGANAIAVRSPAIRWDAQCVVFSLAQRAPSAQFDYVTDARWQLHEICGLGLNDASSLRKIPHQHEDYNYVDAIYALQDDHFIVSTDIPHAGVNAVHLNPLRDEYDRALTTGGLWLLDAIGGDMRLLVQSPSGAFEPVIDDHGRLLFSAWDHLEQDLFLDSGFAIDWASEAANAGQLPQAFEYFPEPRGNETNPVASPYGPMSSFNFKFFIAWQMNAADFTGVETLNHIGRHELMSYVWPSFMNDAALGSSSQAHAAAGHMMRITPDPLNPQQYYFVDAPHFGAQGSGRVYKMFAEPGRSPSQMPIQQVTDYDAQFVQGDGNGQCDHPANGYGGRHRHILPLSNGQLLSAHSDTVVYHNGSQCTDYTTNLASVNDQVNLLPNYNFQLVQLVSDGQGLLQAGPQVTPLIERSLFHWGNGDGVNTAQGAVPVHYSGPMWQLYPQRVAARVKPVPAVAALPLPEQTIFQQEGVNPAAFQAQLKSRSLALIVSRNVTRRDAADQQQPYNLNVPGGASTVVNGSDPVYDVPFWEIFQGDLVRDHANKPGRAVKPVPLHAADGFNPPVSGVPNPAHAGAYFKVAADGSVAAIVPANRALTWQLTDAAGFGVVKERVWVNFQAGEIRVCAACHGINDADQLGNPAPQNPPEALRILLNHWQQNLGDLIYANGFE